MSLNSNPYSPPSHKPPLDRLTDSVKAITDRALASPTLNNAAGTVRDGARRSAVSVKKGAGKAYQTVRANPTPFIIGAAAVGILAALLLNRRSRETGIELAEKAWSKLVH